MNHRIKGPATTIALVAIGLGLFTGVLRAERDFNLAERKQKQPWLWETPRRPEPPAIDAADPTLGPEDRFLRQRLRAAGLSPAPAAEDRTWLRRVHFAITGLPPTREEIHAFLADGAPGARERVVDRLLASPHYGERWARHWMDLMRYAESRGHEGDYHIANAWQYRDYLIRAFNADVPYNQFLLEHLAGDVLPQPRLRPGTDVNESVLGTGWAFLGEELHSPVDIRGDECERLDNKVDVFSKTFLGLTVSCARCHDHKFDPIRARDYYALTGFMLGSSYRQVRFEAMENNRRMAAELAQLRRKFLPRLAAAMVASSEPGIAQSAEYLRAAWRTLRNGPTNGVTPMGPSLNAGRVARWVDQLRCAETNAAHPLHALARRGAVGKAIQDPPDLSGVRVIADFTQPGKQPWKVDGEAFGPRPIGPGEIVFRPGANPNSNSNDVVLGVMSYGAARRDLFWNRLKTAPDNENDSGALSATLRSGQMVRTPTVTLEGGKLHYLIRGKARVYAAVDSHLMIEGPLHGRLVQRFDGGLGEQPQWVTHDLTPYSGHRAHVEFGPDGDGELEILMVVESGETPRWRPTAMAFEASGDSASLEEGEVALQFQQALRNAASELKQAGRAEPVRPVRHAALANWLVRNPALFRDSEDEACAGIRAEYVSAESHLANRVQWESHTAIAWFDGTGVDEHVLVRGKPFKPGELARRSLPAAFASAKPIETAGSSGRYELASQLVDPENPLVARVIVNRVWHHLFGRGIVASVDNFGALGEPPTHPELLDFLAWQFVHVDAWSLKRLIKRLVLTRTFAVSSRMADAPTEQRDPANVFLHRMPVRRLEGEAIRDALLTVSGRLNRTVGGPPVTVHLTEFLVGRGRPEKSGPLDGDGRRSIYTALRRNFLPTLMQTFDAPTPFSTVGKRNVTNVPGQSLALMNDPLFHQQARVWAERLLRETGDGDAANDAVRVGWLFEGAYGREPSSAERAACEETLKELRQLHGTSDSNSVEPWSDLCHALLNANEFIYVQ